MNIESILMLSVMFLPATIVIFGVVALVLLAVIPKNKVRGVHHDGL